MNYQQIMAELKEAGWSNYRINKVTGLNTKTLQNLRDGLVTNPRLTTHNTIIGLYKKEVKKDV